jgi:alkylresorcinol/alkylpyrone synthase/polyketide synthase Type III
MPARPRIEAVSTSVPPRSFTQADLLARFGVTDPRIAGVFLQSHIEKRHLFLEAAEGAPFPVESQGALLARHRAGVFSLAPAAVQSAVNGAGLRRGEIDALCVVTSTGFLVPGLASLLAAHLGLREDVARTDVVGMGCNAGLNGLAVSANWAAAHPGRAALLVCAEICSAAYLFDDTLRTAVVNSLFGDGLAAAIVRAGEGAGPEILDFESHLVPSAADAMRFDWDDAHAKFSFFLDRDIPYVVGAHAERPVDRLLARNQVRRRDVAHWIIHSGGKKVIDAVQYNLGLTAHDVRHTDSVLLDFGNVSSASFLFSYERLLGEGVVRAGDLGVMITMGPGMTIETALVRW